MDIIHFKFTHLKMLCIVSHTTHANLIFTSKECLNCSKNERQHNLHTASSARSNLSLLFSHIWLFHLASSGYTELL